MYYQSHTNYSYGPCQILQYLNFVTLKREINFLPFIQPIQNLPCSVFTKAFFIPKNDKVNTTDFTATGSYTKFLFKDLGAAMNNEVYLYRVYISGWADGHKHLFKHKCTKQIRFLCSSLPNQYFHFHCVI